MSLIDGQIRSRNEPADDVWRDRKKIKKGIEQGSTNMMNCMKCLPRLCRCPLSVEDKKAALNMALESNMWDEKEKQKLRQELVVLDG